MILDLNLGMAFQLQDDYLDAFGDPETFGKQVGGDIIENKKTYLYFKAMEFASAEQKEQLSHLFSIQPNDNSDAPVWLKIDAVTECILIELSSNEVENHFVNTSFCSGEANSTALIYK